MVDVYEQSSLTSGSCISQLPRCRVPQVQHLLVSHKCSTTLPAQIQRTRSSGSGSQQRSHVSGGVVSLSKPFFGGTAQNRKLERGTSLFYCLFNLPLWVSLYRGKGAQGFTRGQCRTKEEDVGRQPAGWPTLAGPHAPSPRPVRPRVGWPTWPDRPPPPLSLSY
jgi:hypothetical protein